VLRTLQEVDINNILDPTATILKVRFGDLLGELLDTMQSLKNLGLNVTRAKIEEGSMDNMFYITDAKTGNKVEDPERLEEIRLSVITNLLQYHPESRESLALGFKRVVEGSLSSPLGVRTRKSIKTTISIMPVPSGARSAVRVETTDRPGLLVDIVETLKDLSLSVDSADIDTVGLKAVDIFYVSYQGTALTKPMVELVINSLQYFLELAEVASEESY